MKEQENTNHCKTNIKLCKKTEMYFLFKFFHFSHPEHLSFMNYDFILLYFIIPVHFANFRKGVDHRATPSILQILYLY